MRSSRALCLGFVLAIAPLATAAVQVESAEERYSFLVGLCEAQEWQLAVREAQGFLREFAGHPKADLARYRLGTALFESGDRRGAREQYATLAARRDFEFRAEVSFRLGQCELALGRPAEAARAFEGVRAAEHGYLALPAEFFLGEARFANAEFAAAEASYRRVLEAHEGAQYARDARYGLIWCAFRTQRHDDVVQQVEDFVRRHAADPVVPELRYLAGEAQLAAGRPEPALAAFDAVRDGEYLERALRGAAFAAAACEDHRDAARRFGALLERFPAGDFAAEAALHRGIELLRAAQPVDAEAALRPLAARDDVEAKLWLARAQLAARHAAGALETIDAALAVSPANESAERLHVLRGDALSELGRGEEAARAYARAASDYALYAAAIASYNAGQLADAARSAASLLERYPDSHYVAEVQLVLGEAALARQDPTAAERAFRSVVDAEGDETLRARALSRIGWCRFLRDDARGAADSFAQLIDRFPDAVEAGEARYMLGRALEKQGAGPAAVAAWRAYLEFEPRGPHAADALLGLTRLDPDGVARWGERLVRDFPESPAVVGVLLERADAAARQGRREDAARGYGEILERYPDHELTVRARYALAWASYESGEFAGAAAQLESLLGGGALAPELALSALELAVWAHSRAGDPRATLAAYERLAAADADPRKLLASARLACAALVELGQAERTRPMLDALLARARGERALQAEILVESAWLAIDAEQADEAEALVRTAWKLGPQDAARASLAEATFFVAELRFQATNDERATELYALAAHEGPAAIQARALYKQGFSYLRRGELERAAAAFARLVEAHPESELAGESLYLLGETWFRAARFAEAVEPLAQLVNDSPQHASAPKALHRLGLCYGELGRWKECESTLSSLARRAPDFEAAAEVELWRGRAHAAQGRRRDARAAFERVLAADRGVLGARARIELGHLAAAAGDDEEALAEYLKVALLYEGGAVVDEASFLAAETLARLGRSDKARARYRELIERDPPSPFAARARERLSALDD